MFVFHLVATVKVYLSLEISSQVKTVEKLSIINLPKYCPSAVTTSSSTVTMETA